MATESRRRVKVYMLNEDRQWDDRGTGHVSSTFVERLKGMSLLVISETDGTLLLESKIQHTTSYQKQQDTLIVWSENENYNLALSFQEKASCDEIWEKICQVQGRDPITLELVQDIVEESEDERFEEIQDTSPPIELPPCELSKLDEISCLCSTVFHSPLRRDKLAFAIEYSGYIQKLIDLFHMCEDLENLDGLHHLYDIFKSIFLLNKNALFEIMFADNMIFSVIGVLEYDPSLPQPAKHRQYLRNTAKFKEVIPVMNDDLQRKIHQTFRVQYIQDVILPTPSVFEENMLSTLNSFIYFNKVEIVTIIQNDEKFLKQLFAQLKDDETGDEKRRDLVFFLKEFCTFSQTLQPQNRDSFLKILSSMGIFQTLEVILGLDDELLKAAAIDIFSYIVEISPSMVRDFILEEGHTQDDDDLLINLVIEQIKSDTDPELGGAVQLMGIVRLLMDPENMLAGCVGKMISEKAEFLNFFYKRCMHVLTAPLFANTAEDKPSKDDYQTSQLLAIILELLTFCVEHHTYHIRNYIFNKDLLRRVLVLLKSKHGFLALGAVRFMRKMIGLKDEFYFGYIIKGHLFKPVVDAFVTNGNRYNLFNSAVIEMFEFIRVDDCKSLVNHIVENYYKSFENVDYVQTFKALKIRYEQQMDRKDKPLDSVPSILRNNRYRRDARMLEDEEEMWFDQEEEMEDAETLVPMTDMLRSKLDNDFEHINKVIESKKAREMEMKESPPIKLHPTRAASPININIKTNPVSTSPLANNQHTHSIITRTGSPTLEDGKINAVTTRKPGLVGLVDYPDEDSDEEDEEGGGDLPAAKRPRLVT
ncbi:serine/threonine-protein phosphatase 4 regulatory subunit 3-like [Tubulanus polymorphus]|uniref:serine/threonine-protein phosphatase 4 regulatory subunit 3-like n=1 Tax=Tubulanus polymorphus TaxID=672921 RepID=UPI003DA21E18